jgi:membrane protease YdiL (CAAX protease family)
MALAAVAWGTFYYWYQLAASRLDAIAAVTLALTIAYGLVGALALPQVPRPWIARLGIAPLKAKYWLHVALLVPALYVGVELQAGVRLLAGRPGGVGIYVLNRELVTTGNGGSLLGVALLALVVSPVLTEWFFRGVVQQGVVDRLGTTRGLLLTSALTAIPQAAPREDPFVWIAVVLSVAWWGFVAGALRITTGSLVAPIAVHAGWNALWLATVLGAESMPIPGFTVTGRSLPVAIVVPAALCTAAGAVLQWRAGCARPKVPMGEAV